MVSDISEPEPDVAVIKGAIRDFANAHPTEAALIVEVADSSVAYDQTVKHSLYARAGIADYWIVNLLDRQLEVYRQPIADADAKYGFFYAISEFYQAGETVRPLAVEKNVVVIGDILP